MTNKTAIVTGANRGIGFEVSRQLAKNGFIVIMGSRDTEKGKIAERQLIDEGLKVKFLQVDVSEQESVEQFTIEFKKDYDNLNVLVNNAGIGVGNSGVIKGDIPEIKQIMGVNFYGPLRMSVSMLPFLKKNPDSRIINVSSGMGAINDLGTGYAGYRLSKSALNAQTILMSNELRGKVIVNAMCPGWVKTDMGGANAPRSVEQGADTIVWLATEPGITSGNFFRDKKVIPW